MNTHKEMEKLCAFVDSEPPEDFTEEIDRNANRKHDNVPIPNDKRIYELLDIFGYSKTVAEVV